MFKLKLKKKVDPHKESLERSLTANEEYLETMVAGTEEYKLAYEVVQKQREELRTYNKPKFGFKEFVELLGAVGVVAGAGATVYSTVHKDETRKEIAQLAYKKEELDNELKNGTIMGLARE